VPAYALSVMLETKGGKFQWSPVSPTNNYGTSNVAENKESGIETLPVLYWNLHRKAFLTFSIGLDVCVLLEGLTPPVSVCLQSKLLCSTAW